jgi:hypothetical protein
MKIVLAIGAALFAAAPHAYSQTPNYETTVRPILSANCFSCHNSSFASGKLNLQALGDQTAASADPQVWERVWEKMASRKMPPPGQP